MQQSFCRKSQFLIFALCTLAVPTISLGQEVPPPHWTYKGPDDPKHWSKLDPAFAACANGHHQSPINIADAKAADLPALKFDYNAVPLSIVDNGHTVMVTYAPGSTLTAGAACRGREVSLGARRRAGASSLRAYPCSKTSVCGHHSLQISAAVNQVLTCHVEARFLGSLFRQKIRCSIERREHVRKPRLRAWQIPESAE
jgi:hypothetical protein